MGNALVDCLLRFYSNNFCWWYVRFWKKPLLMHYDPKNNQNSHDNDNKQDSSCIYSAETETGQFQFNYHIYDISNDIIKLRYFVSNKEHKICVPRHLATGQSSMKQIYDQISSNFKLMRQMLEYPILDATLNDSVDITERLCQYLGHQGLHLIHGHSVKIKWILTPHEIPEFKKLCVLTDKCKTIIYTNINDFILLQTII